MQNIDTIDAVGDRASIEGLEAFVTVARLGSVGAAAKRLGRTQPAVSARLAALETVWDTRLFVRQARGMRLTPEGERLLPAAVAALDAMTSVDRAAGVATGRRVEVRIGSGDALGRRILPDALGALRTEHPGVAVRVVEGSTRDLLESLRRGEIDLAAVTGRTPPERELCLEPLLESPLELLLPRDRTPRGRRGIALTSLDGDTIVTLQPGSSFRRHVENAFGTAGVDFRPAVEVGSFSLVRRYVAAGLGVAPVPAVAFAGPRPPDGVQTRRLLGVEPVAYRLAQRAGGRLTAPTERLVELIRQAAAACRS